MTPAPSPFHQRASKRLQRQLERYFEDTGRAEVFNSPINLILSPHDIAQPDLAVVTDRWSVVRRGIEAPPLLVVEVLSPSTERLDRGTRAIATQPSASPITGCSMLIHTGWSASSWSRASMNSSSPPTATRRCCIRTSRALRSISRRSGDSASCPRVVQERSVCAVCPRLTSWDRNFCGSPRRGADGGLVD